jgi:hypothetical protein
LDQHPHDDIESFALGVLPKADADRLLLHADTCPTCAVLLADAIQVAQTLGSDIEDRPLRRPLDTHVRTAALKTKPSRTISLWPALAFTAMAAVLLLVAWNLRTSAQKPVVPIALLVHSHFVHHPLHGPSGSAKVLQALDGSWVYLVADGLTPHATYVLWEQTKGRTHALGAFKSDAHGEATAYWEQAAGKIDRFAVGSTRAAPSDSANLRWP